jgi:hypothetical protein
MKYQIKQNGLYITLFCIALFLLLGVFLVKPVYANAEKDEKALCERCTFVGITVNCYDYHCTLDPELEHGVYFRYHCIDICTQQAWDQLEYKYCRSTC